MGFPRIVFHVGFPEFRLASLQRGAYLRSRQRQLSLRFLVKPRAQERCQIHIHKAQRDDYS
jgi:hypothetical protein